MSSSNRDVQEFLETLLGQEPNLALISSLDPQDLTIIVKEHFKGEEGLKRLLSPQGLGLLKRAFSSQYGDEMLALAFDHLLPIARSHLVTLTRPALIHLFDCTDKTCQNPTFPSSFLTSTLTSTCCLFSHLIYAFCHSDLNIYPTAKQVILDLLSHHESLVISSLFDKEKHRPQIWQSWSIGSNTASQYDTIRFRFLDLFASVANHSHLIYSLLKEYHLLDGIVINELLDKEDLLIRLNTLELISQLVIEPWTMQDVQSSGIVDRLMQMIDPGPIDQPRFDSLTLSNLLRLIGTLSARNAYIYRQLIIPHYQSLFQWLAFFLTNADEEISMSALFCFTQSCKTRIGLKTTLQADWRAMTSPLFDEWRSAISSSNQYSRATALTLLADVFNEHGRLRHQANSSSNQMPSNSQRDYSSSVQSKRSEYDEKDQAINDEEDWSLGEELTHLLYLMFRDTTNKGQEKIQCRLIQKLEKLINDYSLLVKYGSLSCIKALAPFKWALTEMVSCESLFPLLLDRSAKTEKADKELKYDVVLAIVHNPDSSEILGPYHHGRLIAYLKDGVFGNQYEYAVSVSEGKAA